jgi:hypothetical protein
MDQRANPTKKYPEREKIGEQIEQAGHALITRTLSYRSHIHESLFESAPSIWIVSHPPETPAT